MKFEKVGLEEALSDYKKAGEKFFDSEIEEVNAIIMPEVRIDEKLEGLRIPTRATKKSAGYDFYMPYSLMVPAKTTVRFPLFIKCTEMPSNIVLLIANRSSLALKKGLSIDNAIGVIDSDYSKDIWFQATNRNVRPIFLTEGDRICQGIFTKIMLVDNDEVISEERKGGMGSTGK